jgi:parallel beta-helix repeat protein
LLYIDGDENHLVGGEIFKGVGSDLYYGVYMDSSEHNSITGSYISDCEYGIYLESSDNNIIYNNYFNNTNNAYDGGTNIWNVTKTNGTNIIGGPNLGGNYWSDYTGDDTTGADGLGDEFLPYNASGGIVNGGDWLPLTAVGEAPKHVHNLDTLENFSTIQAAIYDSATENGDTIEVDPGTYTENVEVYKSLTIRSASVDPADTIVCFEGSYGAVFGIIADSVNISGFTVTGAHGDGSAGISLGNVQHCNITNNILSDNDYGFYLWQSSNNTFVNNTIVNNSMGGIYLRESSNNTLANNTASNNSDIGIYLDWSSNNNTLAGNTVSNNTEVDFYSTDGSENNTITDLTVSSYATTISFTYGNGIDIKGVDTVPADPGGWQNISKYVNITNVTVSSWIDLQMSYNDTELGDVSEASLTLWKYYGTDWSEVPNSTVDTGANLVSANITEFSMFRARIQRLCFIRSRWNYREPYLVLRRRLELRCDCGTTRDYHAQLHELWGVCCQTRRVRHRG